jgi:hypothetical protein
MATNILENNKMTKMFLSYGHFQPKDGKFGFTGANIKNHINHNGKGKIRIASTNMKGTRRT